MFLHETATPAKLKEASDRDTKAMTQISTIFHGTLRFLHWKATPAELEDASNKKAKRKVDEHSVSWSYKVSPLESNTSRAGRLLSGKTKRNMSLHAFSFTRRRARARRAGGWAPALSLSAWSFPHADAAPRARALSLLSCPAGQAAEACQLRPPPVWRDR